MKTMEPMIRRETFRPQICMEKTVFLGWKSYTAVLKKKLHNTKLGI